jgi:hypothetical protein
MSELVQLIAIIAEIALGIFLSVPPSQARKSGSDEAKEDSLACLACRKEIPEGQSRCPACGWSYDGEDHT